jgi:hypothetical protein
MTAARSEEDRTPAPLWMAAQEVAVALGCQVETVYAMARAGTLPGRAARHAVVALPPR